MIFFYTEICLHGFFFFFLLNRKENSQLTVHSPKCPQELRMGQGKIRARNSIQVSMWVAGNELFGPSVLHPEVCISKKPESGVRAECGMPHSDVHMAASNSSATRLNTISQIYFLFRFLMSLLKYPHASFVCLAGVRPASLFTDHTMMVRIDGWIISEAR